MTDPHDPHAGTGDPVLPPSRFGAGYTVGGGPPAEPVTDFPPPPSYPAPSSFPPPDQLRYPEPVVHDAVAPVPHYPVQPVYVGVPVRRTNSMAITALVSALLFGPLGIIFGHIALSQIKRTGEDGHGLAIAGLVIGYIALAFIVLWLLFFVGFAVLVTTAGGPAPDPVMFPAALS